MYRHILTSFILAATLALGLAPPAAPAGEQWQWPVDERRHVMRAFEQPVHDYAAGHRGMKIAAAVGGEVIAPTDARVVFRGAVAGRDVITLETSVGLIITLEPVSSDLTAGESVARGAAVGTLATGGPSPPGQLHVGVRLDGNYLDPLPFFGKVPRAVLYPCC